jgi:hypothetical protein
MSQSYGFDNGGNYAVGGVDVELMYKKNFYSVVNFSLVSGASYLSNGFNKLSNYSYTFGTYTYYDTRSTQIQMTQWQVPIVLRINFRPFPLMEDWRLFFGGGVVMNNLTSAHMAEQWTLIQKGINSQAYPGLFAPPSITHYEDSRDVTSYAPASATFERFEFGMKFKHFQVTYRLSTSTQDMYFKGIEKVWRVPATQSQYIDAHKSRGITKEKLSEIVFGWRL